MQAKNCRFMELRSLTRAHENSRSSVSTRRIDVKFAAIGPTKMKTVKSLQKMETIFLTYGPFLHTESHISQSRLEACS